MQHTSTHPLGTPLKDPYPISGRDSFKGEGCNTLVLPKALAKEAHWVLHKLYAKMESEGTKSFRIMAKLSINHNKKESLPFIQCSPTNKILKP